MRFERRYTQAGKSPFAGMAFHAVDSEIRNPDGSIVFSMKGIDVPAEWSQVATSHAGRIYLDGERFPLPQTATDVFRRLHEQMRDDAHGAWFSARIDVPVGAAKSRPVW